MTLGVAAMTRPSERNGAAANKCVEEAAESGVQEAAGSAAEAVEERRQGIRRWKVLLAEKKTL
jgi:hypothetical protein